MANIKDFVYATYVHTETENGAGIEILTLVADV